MFITVFAERDARVPRPCCLRHIGFTPNAGLFRPAGIPVCALEQVMLTLDEVEALRLADLNGLYQEQAAEQMKISRPTFSRIVEQARRKVADALIHGKALRLEGGVIRMKTQAEMPQSERRGCRRDPGPCGCERRRGRKDAGRAESELCRGHETQREIEIQKGERRS
ncbi:MAG: DUF134 domain-containing protein [Phycisphaerales bacterium]